MTDPAENDPAAADASEPGRSALIEALGIPIGEEILTLALTHRSYAYENGGLPTNERLEFLGDSVLGLIITDTLYRANPDLAEGQLAKLRASVVNMRALAELARGLGPKGLGAALRLGAGEKASGGADKDSILADAFEALLGAIYIDQGLPGVSALVGRLFADVLDEAATKGAGLDWKTSLQELTARLGLGAVAYRVVDDGPDHEKTFTAYVDLGGHRYGSGMGRSKKDAEQHAAAQAWQELSVLRGAAD
ncbi:MAG: ribonuclease III [Geodermatophilaceae bacterium]|nr:ribonuclease III [Geodermatophilaceae bacterium]